MPEKKTVERARRDRAQGKSASTQAGEFVREEMDHIREGKHGARSTKQAIAIGLSKARRAGVKLSPPRRGATSERTRRQAARDERKGRSGTRRCALRAAARPKPRANACATPSDRRSAPFPPRVWRSCACSLWPGPSLVC